MDSHLVTIVVGVEAGSNEWVKLDSFTIDKLWLERLDRKTVERRSAVQEDIATLNNFVKGIGVGKENYEYYGFKVDADDMYVDLLCQTGIVGFVLFLTFYVFTLILLWKKRGGNRDLDFLIAVFLAYLVEGWGESVFDTPMFWFWGLVAVLAINEKECIQRKEKIPANL